MSNKKMEMQELFPRVDKERTIEDCKHHLLVTLPRMVRISGISLNSLRSPNMDGMPKTQSHENHADDTIVRRLAAEQVVKETVKAMGRCDNASKECLSMLYLDHYTDRMCFMQLGYSESHYFHVIKPSALLQFADGFLMYDMHTYIIDGKPVKRDVEPFAELD